MKIVDQTYKSAFEYGIKDLQMELTIKYAEAVILEALLRSDSESVPDEIKKSILEHVKRTFPCEFTDPETLSDQKKNLLLLFNKLGYHPIEPKLGFEGDTIFREFYLSYLEQIRSFAFSQQNEINTLLDIQKLEKLSTEKANKRINIIPRDVYRSFN
ncbi:MAG: hypothetical protein U5K71_04815 [Gracilimonas sp.]|nr:hypothetical protein [Gracilimonas sp.]